MVANVVICTETNSQDKPVSERFARTNYFCLYDRKLDSYTFYVNTAKEEMSGAGGKAVKQLSTYNTDVVLVPEIGPKAYDALNAFELKAFQYPKDSSVKEAIELFYKGELKEVSAPSTIGKH